MMTDDFPLIAEVEQGAPPDTKAVGVAFGFYAIPDQKKTAEAGGIPQFKDVEFVKIVVPGDKTQEYFNAATDRDRKKYPRAYEAFKRRGQVPLEGLPIEKWAMVTRAEALNMKALNIHTVEMLAEVHEGNLGNLGLKGRDLIARAKTFLAQARETEGKQALAAENQALKDRMADLERQIAEIAPKRGPGRPPRQAEAA